MARKTDGEKVDELVATVTTLIERVGHLREELHRLEAIVLPFRQDLEAAKSQLLIHSREIDESKKSRDEWGRRWWSLFVPVVTAIVGGVIGYFLKH
jgi:uncharacterized small protein (DUF1192 family)